MLVTRSPQRRMFEADHLYLHFVGRHSFYGFLPTERGNLFRDEDFGRLYCPDNGRKGVTPSLLARALLPQVHDRDSDGDAKRRPELDLGWKVALKLPIETTSLRRARCNCFGANSFFTTPSGWCFSAVWSLHGSRATCRGAS